MSALIITIDAQGPDAVKRVLGGALAGTIVPAHVVADAAAESRELLETEAVVPEVFATRYAGESIASKASGLTWCAIACPLPKPGGGVLHDVWLRFAVGLGTAREKLVPLVTLRVKEEQLVLRFGMHGAPFIAPPSRDHGGPIDQAWQRASKQARDSMGRALARLETTASLSGEGLDAAALTALSEAWKVPFSADDAAPSTLAVPSIAAGKCRACRHANQGTEDLVREGILACAIAGPRPLHLDPVCDVVWTIDQKKWFAFEPFDGGNSTWGYDGEVRVKVPSPAKK